MWRRWGGLLLAVGILFASAASAQLPFLDNLSRDPSDDDAFGLMPWASLDTTSFPPACSPGYCIMGFDTVSGMFDCGPCSGGWPTATVTATALITTPTYTIPFATPTPQLTAAAAPVACRTAYTALGPFGGLFKDNPAECLATPAPTATVTSTAAVTTPTYTVPFATPTPQLTAAAAPCTCRTVSTAVGVLGGMFADNPCACVATPAPTATMTTSPTFTVPWPTPFATGSPQPVGQAPGFFNPANPANHGHAVDDPFQAFRVTPTSTPTATSALATATPTSSTPTATPAATPAAPRIHCQGGPVYVQAGDVWVDDGRLIARNSQAAIPSSPKRLVLFDTDNGDTASGQFPLQMNRIVRKPAASSATSPYAGLFELETSRGINQTFSGSSAAIRAQNYHLGNGAMSGDLQGAHFLAVNGAPFVPTTSIIGTVSGTVFGLLMQAWNTSGATGTAVANLVGTVSDARNRGAGAVTKLVAGLYTVGSTNEIGSSTITAATGVEVSGINITGVDLLSGGTITDGTMLRVGDWNSGPTYTNRPLGLHLVQQTATGAVSYKNDGRTVEAPDTAQAITAVGNTIAIDTTTHRLTADASYTLTSTPTLADGEDGQRVLIINVDGGADVITIQDQGTLAGSNLRLGATTRALGPRDSIMLMYSSTIGDWIEIAFTNVL